MFKSKLSTESNVVKHIIRCFTIYVQNYVVHSFSFSKINYYDKNSFTVFSFCFLLECDVNSLPIEKFGGLQ